MVLLLVHRPGRHSIAELQRNLTAHGAEASDAEIAALMRGFVEAGAVDREGNAYWARSGFSPA